MLRYDSKNYHAWTYRYISGILKQQLNIFIFLKKKNIYIYILKMIIIIYQNNNCNKCINSVYNNSKINIYIYIYIYI